MNPFDRRDFLRQAAAGVGAAASVSAPFARAAASQRAAPVRMGVIGCGGIAQLHLKGFTERSDARVDWLCDVDPEQIEQSQKLLQSAPTGSRPKTTGSHADVLADPAVDAVLIATPHHWHAPLALAAIAAGKDVYLEKPISHVFDEGPLIIDAARKHKRIVQQGSQMRSSPVTLQAEKVLRDGAIGDIKVARAWTAEKRAKVEPRPDGEAPPRVDYDRWLGPAPKRPFNPLRFHQSWRLFSDYANGEIGDDGVHDIDMACWALGVTELPVQITARGGTMMLHGSAGDYPDNMSATFEFADGRLLVYESLPFTRYGMHGFDNGNVFYGTEGYMVFSRRGAFETYLGPKSERGATEDRSVRGERGYPEHMTDFLNSVKTRQPPRARPEVAHISCALVHLAEIAFRTAGRLRFDPAAGEFVDHDEANSMLSKHYREPYTLPKV
ncbi:Gfo/Idh/MocA family oxidoreductase [Botrimarina sp.]|uniref:Gfo/Idh/MocA family protein n=1 Tax=Botrimarina sp. TaxID=2795802 RepID=UPI0032ECF6E6